jgi:hypothetical protein
LQQVQAKVEKERNKKSKGIAKAAKTKTKSHPVEEQDGDDDEEDDEDYDDEHDNMDEENDDDEDETETDEEEDIPPKTSKKKNETKTSASTKSPIQKKTQPSIKIKRTVAKTSTSFNAKKASKSNATDWISLIQNKHRDKASSNSAWADFGARYGVAMPENENDDPIPDNATFQKIQSKLKNHKGKKK